MGVVRHESSVLAVSWIPSEAVSGVMRLPFETGAATYDQPPPDRIDVAAGELDGLTEANRFRCANLLRAWIEVDQDGTISGHGCDGGGRVGRTVVKLGPGKMTFAAIPLPDLQRPPEIGDSFVRFVQTAGGRTGAPAPRRVSHRPFVQWAAPLAWTTLALTLWVDGRTEHTLVGSSPFPRHWIYDASGQLVAKSGLIDYKHWYHAAFGAHSPWGDEEFATVSAPVESAAERTLSERIMHQGHRPKLRSLRAGDSLCREGEPGLDVFLLLDGLLSVEVDGTCIAEVGPGAIIGERALLEGGRRTATVRACTPCRVAVAARGAIDTDVLLEVRTGHLRELGL